MQKTTSLFRRISASIARRHAAARDLAATMRLHRAARECASTMPNLAAELRFIASRG